MLGPSDVPWGKRVIAAARVNVHGRPTAVQYTLECGHTHRRMLQGSYEVPVSLTTALTCPDCYEIFYARAEAEWNRPTPPFFRCPRCGKAWHASGRLCHPCVLQLLGM